jgi:CDP-6-deoxy-D-xylo-4-hexulose-3-dehydrase
LLAVSALTSKKLGQKRLQAGDEVITVAGGFPTTVGPLIQNGLVPVFIDLEPLEAGTYNADVEMLEEAVSDRTRGVILAHTLGNPFQVDVVTKFAKDRGLWFVEDNCDALGSRFAGRLTGSFGHLATSSFYPAHHITMGEGGCVLTDRGRLKTLVESFRDWGRDCWCEPGDADTCGKRFNWKLGKLPRGYDHKYIFSHVGYNMKVTDMQAAAGVSQLKKLDRFVAARRANFDHLSKALADLEDLFVLPQATERSEPSWFGFPLSVRTDAGFDRRELVTFLDTRNIDTRMLFAGNLARQPAYQDRVFRSIGDLVQTDRVMESTFWIGVYPGLSEAMIDYVSESIHTFSRGKK